MGIETIFLDIDGTLFYKQKLIASAKEAVAQLQAKGYTVALCTGRSVLHTKPLQAKLNIHHAVYFNGGLTESRGALVDAHPLSPAVVERMLQYTNEREFPLILHTSKRALAPRPVPQTYNPILRAYDFPPIQVVESLPLEEPVYQSNVMFPVRFDTQVRDKFPECLLYRWHSDAVDLQKAGCNKAVGAQALLQSLGASPETALHIGDGGNDIGMFQFVGTSVAMGNATPEVQEHATMVTDSADEDGVFNALRKLQLI